MPDIRVPRPLTADDVYDRLKDLHQRIVFDLQADNKTEDWMPEWYAHLPSGEKVRIRTFTTDGPLVRLTSFDKKFILLAPDAVVVTVEPQPPDPKGVPVEFLDAGDED